MPRTTMKYARLRIHAVALVLAAIAMAPTAAISAAGKQDPALAQMQKKLDQSLQLIQALSERVRELEAKQAAATPVAVPAAATPAPRLPAQQLMNPGWRRTNASSSSWRRKMAVAPTMTRVSRCTASPMSASARTIRSIPT